MSISWLLFAFSGPVLWAVSVHLDKYLLERYFKGIHPAVSLSFTGIIDVVALPVLWAVDPNVFDLSWRTIVLMSLSGFMLMAAMLFYLMALKYNEASVVAPFFQASPVFGVALGFGVLGERLNASQIIGIALTIAGAFAAGAGGRRRPHNGLVLLMLSCAAMVALSSLIFKIFSVQERFWPTTFWMFVGQAIFGCGLLAIGTFRRELYELLRTNTIAIVGINAVNEIVNLLGSLGLRYALVLAPLSLVQAISSTTSVFVFLIGVVLSIVAPKWGREDLAPRELTRKAAAAIMVSVGVALLTV